MKGHSFASMIERWETHHRILAFLLILLLTVFFVRGSTRFIDPAPNLLGVELHHFDYGLLLLFIVTLTLLFEERSRPILLALAAVAFGLILDELWFIRRNVFEGWGALSYGDSFFSVVVLVVVIVLVMVLLRRFVFVGQEPSIKRSDASCPQNGERTTRKRPEKNS